MGTKLSVPLTIENAPSPVPPAPPQILVDIEVEDEVLVEPPSNWVLTHCLALSLAVYERDPLQTMTSNDFISHNCTTCSVSHRECYDGRVIVAEAQDGDGCEYLFVCFRGTDNFDDVIADINAKPTLCDLGVVHSGFLERSKSLPLLSIVNSCRTKRVVITGHSLGGACATLLAARFFSIYGHFACAEDQLSVVTFGSPLVAGPSMGTYMTSRKKHFHNYILGQDLVPRALTIMDVILPAVTRYALSIASYALGMADMMQQAVESLSLFKHFGNFYYLDVTSPTESARRMSAAEIKFFFEDNGNNRVITPAMITDHSIVKYKNTLWQGTIEGQRLDPAQLSLQPRELRPLHNAITVRHCGIQNNNKFFVHGHNLSYVLIAEVNRERLRAEHSDENVAVFTCSDRTTMFLQGAASRRAMVRVYVLNLFGQRVEVDVMCRIQTGHGVLTPDKVLRNVFPLVSLLVRVRDPSSPSQSQSQLQNESVLDEMYVQCKCLGSMIPIEFAFRTMEKNFTGDDDVVVTTFLNRLKQVQIDWQNLCSEVMVLTLMNSIKRLNDGSLNEEEISQRYHYYNKAFGGILQPSPTIPTVYLRDTFQIQHEASQEDFLHTICHQRISFTVDMFAGTPDSLEAFVGNKGDMFHVAGGYTVKNIERVGLGVNRDIVIVTSLVEVPMYNHHRYVYHYMFRRFDDQMSKACQTALELLVYNIIVYNDRLNPRKAMLWDRARVSPRSALFLYVYGLLSLTSKECVEPSHQQRVWDDLKANTATFEVTSEQRDTAHRIAKNLNDKDFLSNMFGFLRRRNESEDARVKAANILETLLQHMSSDYNFTKSDYLCGESIMMQVKDSLHSGQMKPFLDLFPHPMSSSTLAVASLEDKQQLLNLAAESSAKADYLAVILEDAMVLFDRVIEAERSTMGMVGHSIVAVVKAALSVPYSAMKVVAGVITWNRRHVVDAGKHMTDIFHYAFYCTTDISTYPKVVTNICETLSMPYVQSATLEEKERFVVSLLPSRASKLPLNEVVLHRISIFEDSPLKLFLHGKSAGLMIFFLKTLYHCYQLRILRKSVMLATISGIQNAGKTTLVKEIFGAKIVTAPTGSTPLETTIFPSAYFDPEDRGTIFCDLPGCGDADTAQISNLFLTLGDMTVFVMPQNLSKNPSGQIYHELLKKILNCSGPRLVCINSADMVFRMSRGVEATEEELVQKLVIERDAWRAHSVFTSFLKTCTINSSAECWECERGMEGGLVASTRSGSSCLSIWLTAFDPGYNANLSSRVLFNSSHVKRWVEEVKTLCSLKYVD